MVSGMGVSIHYSGALDDVSRICDLQHELVDIAGSMGWGHHVFDDDWSVAPNATLSVSGKGAEIKGHLGLKGVHIFPPGKSEPLTFLFSADGCLRSLLGMINAGDDEQSDAASKIVSVKTQFVDSSVHIWITGLLKYLKRKYISDLRVEDEGGYWESGDRVELEARLKFLQDKIDQLATGLSSVEFADCGALSADEIADRIADFVQKRFSHPDDKAE